MRPPGLRHRKAFSAIFFFFTTLFSGGLVPWYLLIVNYLDLKDTLLVLILPMLMNSNNSGSGGNTNDDGLLGALMGKLQGLMK